MKKIIYILLAASVSFLSCKKDTTEPASKSITFQDIYPKEGFIKGTITGKTSANENFTKTFNYESVQESSTELDPNQGDTIYTISIARVNADNQLTNTNREYMNLTFKLKKDRSTLISLDDFTIYTDIKMQNNTTTRFEASYYKNQQTNNTALTLSNVKFNPSTGSISADYTLLIDTDDNESGNLATVSGSFSSMNTNFVYRKSN